MGHGGRRRARHVRVENNVVEFTVQYEICVRDEWYPVVRYDTAHGFAHRDIISYNGDVKKEEIPFDDFNLALTYAESDLRNNWSKYRAMFLKGVSEDD